MLQLLGRLVAALDHQQQATHTRTRVPLYTKLLNEKKIIIGEKKQKTICFACNTHWNNTGRDVELVDLACNHAFLDQNSLF